MKEIESMDIRSQKSDRLEVREPAKPMLDNRDMCGLMCIICAALITYLMFAAGLVVCHTKLQLVGTVVSFIFVIAVALFWITQKIVQFCHVRTKRKAQDIKSRT